MRGLLIAVSGFLFIFSPALPMGRLARRVPSLGRDLVYWGIGVWLVALLPSLFLQSLLRQAVQAGAPARPLSGTPEGYGFTLVGSLLTACFVMGGIYLVLRWRKMESASSLPDGLAIGFGVGLVAQVFTGLSLVGAGFRLLLGGTEDPAGTLTALARVPMLQLVAGLVALIVFRIALLTVSAGLGVLVARSAAGERGAFWRAVVLDAAFAWGILALQLAIGSDNPGGLLAGSADLKTSVVAIAYYAGALALAYHWLLGQTSMALAGGGRRREKSRSHPQRAG